MAHLRIGGRSVDVADAGAEFDRCSTLPAAFYLDPELFELERERVLAASWLPMARADAVAAPGSYVTAEVAGEDLVAVRDPAGVLRVLSNVCRHRAMPVAAGRGPCTVLVCPYHRWTYRPDGTLSGAPMMGGTADWDRGAVRLPPVRHELWNGWLLVDLSGTARPLAEQVTGLTEALRPWHFEDLRTVATVDYDADWNWKVSVENFSEYYHHIGLHRDSLDPLLPARTGRCLEPAGQPWSSSVLDCSEEYLALQGEPMPRLPAAQADTMQIATVFPLLCIGGQPGSAFWLEVLPRSVDHHVLRWHVLVRPEQAADPAVDEFVAASLRALDLIQAEDTVANRGVQRGLRSRWAAPGRLAPLERPLWQFNRWLLRTLADEAPDRDGTRQRAGTGAGRP